MKAKQLYRQAITTTFAGVLLRDEARKALACTRRFEQAHDEYRQLLGLPPALRLGTGRWAFEVPRAALDGELTTIVAPRSS